MLLQGLYAITDPDTMPGPLLFAKVEAALRGGCKIVQYRNKFLPQDALIDEAKKLRVLCHDFGAHLIVNDSLTVALQSDADGVHLGQQDMSVSKARQQVSNNFCIGTTCHNALALAQQAQADGANYVAFGRFFSSRTKANAKTADSKILEQAKAKISLPLVAIGGINLDNATSLIDKGADCLAVSYDLFHHAKLSDIEQRANQYSRLFEIQ